MFRISCFVTYRRIIKKHRMDEQQILASELFKKIIDKNPHAYTIRYSEERKYYLDINVDCLKSHLGQEAPILSQQHQFTHGIYHIYRHHNWRSGWHLRNT